MLAELTLAVVLTGNLKIVKPAIIPVAPARSTTPAAPVLRLYPDLPEPYDQLPVSEDQYRKLLEIFEKRREKIERYRRELKELEEKLQILELGGAIETV